MPKILFQKGNKLAKGGKREGAGPKTKREKSIKAEAAEYAKKYLAKEINKVLGKYKKTALGVKVRKHHPKTGRIYHETEWDTSNQRHWIDKFLPSAKQEIDLNARIVVKVDAFDPDAG